MWKKCEKCSKNVVQEQKENFKKVLKNYKFLQNDPVDTYIAVYI